jgi:hypothetical protein
MPLNVEVSPSNLISGSSLEEFLGSYFELKASFEFRVGVLPGQARAQARRSERLTRVGEVS